MNLKKIQNQEINTKKILTFNIKNIQKILMSILFMILLFPMYKFIFPSNENRMQKEKIEKNDDLIFRESIIDKLPSSYSSRAIENTIPKSKENKVTIYEEYIEPVKKDNSLEYEARMSGFSKKRKNDTENSNTGALSPSEQIYLNNIYQDNQSDYNLQNKKKVFLKNSTIDNFVLKQVLTPAISKYELKTGTIIPLTILNNLNSDIPGNILALVREDIYDSLTGNIKLIPMGSKVYGQYSSDISFGQKRLQVIFNRIVLPNGKALNLDSMLGSNSIGETGFNDKVETHLTRVLSSVLLTAIIGAGSSIMSESKDSNSESEYWRAAAIRGAGEESISIGNKYTNKVLNIQPVLKINSGYRANIIINKDLILEEYDGALDFLMN